MNVWLKGGLLTGTLLAGFVVGWFIGKKLGLNMPNLWVAALLLVAGTLGAPLLTYKLIGPGLFSYILALGTAGVAAGLAFWPMGEKQGEKEWL